MIKGSGDDVVLEIISWNSIIMIQGRELFGFINHNLTQRVITTSFINQLHNSKLMQIRHVHIFSLN